MGRPVVACDLTLDGALARLLDVVDDRSASVLVSWMNQRPERRTGIAWPSWTYRCYASGLRTALPHAVRVRTPSTS